MGKRKRTRSKPLSTAEKELARIKHMAKMRQRKRRAAIKALTAKALKTAQGVVGK